MEEPEKKENKKVPPLKPEEAEKILESYKLNNRQIVKNEEREWQRRNGGSKVDSNYTNGIYDNREAVRILPNDGDKDVESEQKRSIIKNNKHAESQNMNGSTNVVVMVEGDDETPPEKEYIFRRDATVYVNEPGKTIKVTTEKDNTQSLSVPGQKMVEQFTHQENAKPETKDSIRVSDKEGNGTISVEAHREGAVVDLTDMKKSNSVYLNGGGSKVITGPNTSVDINITSTGDKINKVNGTEVPPTPPASIQIPASKLGDGTKIDYPPEGVIIKSSDSKIVTNIYPQFETDDDGKKILGPDGKPKLERPMDVDMTVTSDDGKITRKVPVMRDGKPVNATSDELKKKIDEARQQVQEEERKNVLDGLKKGSRDR